MTDGDERGSEWRLPARDGSTADAVEAVDSRDVLDRVDSLTVYAWEAPDPGGAGTRLSPAAEDLAERVPIDGRRPSAGDVDGLCLAAIQGLSARLADQRARVEAQAITIRKQRDDIESLRERVEALQATVAGGDDGRDR